MLDCSYCFKTFRNWPSLIVHARTHGDEAYLDELYQRYDEFRVESGEADNDDLLDEDLDDTNRGSGGGMGGMMYA